MEERKSNKGLVWLIVILIAVILGLLGYIIYEKFTKVEYGTKEDQIKQNFLNDIKLVKRGEGTEAQNYLLCSDIYNCENIGEFNIDNIEFYENNDDNKPVYKIKLSWSCKSEGECFYNEQYGYNDETKLNEVETFYKVGEDNKIIECLGNAYDFIEDDESDDTSILNIDEFPKTHIGNILWSGNHFDILEKSGVDEYSDFKNISVEIENVDFTLDCEGYNIVGGNACDTFNIMIKDEIIASGGVQNEFDFLITEELVILIDSSSYLGQVAIFDKVSGLRVVDVDTVNSFRKEYNGDNNEYLPKLYNSKLYFISMQEGSEKMYLNYIDLNNGFDIIEVSEVEGYIGEY